MSNYKAPCKDCPDRTVYCHGRNKDGSWVCEAWGEYQVYSEQRKKEKAERMAKAEPFGAYVKARKIKRLHREAMDKR